MMRLGTNSMKQLMAAVMAMSLAVCCCHAHYLTVGLTAGLPGMGSDDSVAARVACCPSPPSSEDAPCRPGDPGDDRSPTPQKGCQSCCIKGSGQKDPGPEITGLVTAALPFLTLPVSIAPATRPERDPRYDVEVTPPDVVPRTLVRLHCALIV